MILLLTLLALPSPDRLAQARQPFLGTWELIQVIKDGKVQEEAIGGKTWLIFSADGSYVGKSGDTIVGKGEYKPLPGTSPAALNWTSASRQEYDGTFGPEIPAVGLYRFDNRYLTINLKFDGKSDDRPKDFECKPGSKLYLIKMKKR